MKRPWHCAPAVKVGYIIVMAGAVTSIAGDTMFKDRPPKPKTLRPIHKVRTLVVRIPGLRNSGASRCPGELHSFKVGICSGRTLEFQDSYRVSWGAHAAAFCSWGVSPWTQALCTSLCITRKCAMFACDSALS